MVSVGGKDGCYDGGSPYDDDMDSDDWEELFSDSQEERLFSPEESYNESDEIDYEFDESDPELKPLLDEIETRLDKIPNYQQYRFVSSRKYLASLNSPPLINELWESVENCNSREEVFLTINSFLDDIRRYESSMESNRKTDDYDIPL